MTMIHFVEFSSVKVQDRRRASNDFYSTWKNLNYLCRSQSDEISSLIENNSTNLDLKTVF